MKHIEKLQELLNDELGDYSMKYEIDFTDGDDDLEYYEVSVKDNYGEKPIGKGYLIFCIDSEKIEVELGEDSWEKIETLDRTIKYFWMALLWT